jgi:hypothetical protein
VPERVVFVREWRNALRRDLHGDSERSGELRWLWTPVLHGDTALFERNVRYIVRA